MPSQNQPAISTSIVPWLSVRNAVKAISFYKDAFDAVEVYRLEDPEGGLVVRLCVAGAEFWISGGNTDNDNAELERVGGDTVRMILTTSDPDSLFQQALNAGATQIFPVGEEFGWRLGRIADPFGLHWEIGKPLTSSF